MNILVTGSNGFLGKNLVSRLKYMKEVKVFEYNSKSSILHLREYAKNCDFVFHLAGVNRSEESNDFMKVNYDFTNTLLNELKKAKNNCPVMFSSSIHATKENFYGRSKKAAENLIFEYGRTMQAKVFIYRFTNVFGKWCKPNYNSVVATFSYNIANELPIKIDNNAILSLTYIDDLVNELINSLKDRETRKGDFCFVKPIYKVELKKIVSLLNEFKQSRNKLIIPKMSDSFTKKLYSTYLSYLPENKFGYQLKMNVDHRGSFTEFVKNKNFGQISVNITKPGIVKGNHWHNTKNEKFLVVHGNAIIRFRKISENKIYEYIISGENFEVIDVPPGYSHNIENVGKTDLITIMWANEIFDSENPDTFFLEV